MAACGYFGTDGIRGRVGSFMIHPKFMMRLGWAVGKVLFRGRAATVLIAHDGRLSSDMLSSALQSGLLAAGINVALLGILPTPAVAYLTRIVQAGAGIVISASHNAYWDNGVKFFNGWGMKLVDKIEQEITAQLEESMEFLKHPVGTLRAFGNAEATRHYVEFCKTILPKGLDLQGLKLILDCANGATYQIAPRIFSELGAEVITINAAPNGTNINFECGTIDTRHLQATVLKYNADVGLAFDGDGDRLIMVDQQGECVDGDEMLCILAKEYRDFSKANRAGIVGTVMSNLGLEQSLLAQGFSFERAAVGDRYVLETLLKKRWVLGGEASGHIVNLDYTTTGDGIVTALQILRIIKFQEQPLHELKKIMIKRPQVLINVPISKSYDLNANEEISKVAREIEQSFKGEGRVLLRASGTEPVIRVMVEGNDREVVQNAANFLSSFVAKCVEHGN